jgi:hypothetical protein
MCVCSVLAEEQPFPAKTTISPRRPATRTLKKKTKEKTKEKKEMLLS